MKKKKTLLLLALSGLLVFGAPSATANAAWKTTSAGTIYTQTASPGYATGMKKIGKKLYFFSKKGILIKDWFTYKKKRYYADPKTGELAVSKWIGAYYFQDDGSLAVNTWVEGKWVGADGRYTGVKNNVGWLTENQKTYYYDATTHQPIKGWFTEKGKTYYFDPVTGALKKGWFTVGSKTYYSGTGKGVLQTNKWVSGKYLQADGSVAVGLTTIGKYTYYFNSSGKKRTGWIKYDNASHYFDKKGLLQKNTWVGKRYVDANGILANGWTNIGKYTYYFTPNGYKKTGWITLNDGKKYFLNKSGQLQKKRWLFSKGFYASADGSILKGLNAINGYIYYFNPSTGKKTVNALTQVGSDYYYFQKNGTAAKNQWISIKSAYYYFKRDGKMAKNTWIGSYYVGGNGARTKLKKTVGWSTSNGIKYYFDAKGNMTTGLATISGQKYYFSSTGAMQTGLQEINNRKYYFYPDGTMAVSTTLVIASKQYTLNASGVVTSEENLKISGKTKGAQIANYGLQFVGNKYVYGGTSLTNGADCSGFTQTIFKTFGINLMRVADDQMKGPSSYYQKLGYKKGMAVDTASMQPGDLIFYGYGNYASHVGIYIGNGKIVHASNSRPYPSGGIKVSAYNYQTPLKIVRYWH